MCMVEKLVLIGSAKKCLYECLLWWFYMSEESDIDDIVEDDFEDDLDEDLDDDTNGVTERR